MKIEKIKISELKNNPNNPRVIMDEQFDKLVKSINEFPEMLDIRPIVVDDNMMVLGGNMRLKACIKSGLKEVSIIKASNLTEEQIKEFIIKDNVGYGEWDWNLLQTEWDVNLLSDWGLDIAVLPQPMNLDDDDDDVNLLEEKWFLNIEMDSENDCQEWYDKLVKEGLNCKIVQ